MDHRSVTGGANGVGLRFGRVTAAGSAAAAIVLSLTFGCGGASRTGSTSGGMGSGAGGDGQAGLGGGALAKGGLPMVDPTLGDTKGKMVKTFDLNKDNRPDVWKMYKTIEEGGTTLEVLTCKQVDLDHDGQKDYVVGYHKKGGMEFEKFDFTFDGKFDAFARYDPKTGNLYVVERDSDFDGRFDLEESYDKDGVLVSVHRDRNGDNETDVWEQYEGGQLVGILWDDDFDKRVDRREEIKREAAPVAPPAGGEAPAESAPAGDGVNG